MVHLLLVIIYITFISLGLPDSLLGAAWPSMYSGLHVPISYAGIISMIIAGGTIISSLISARLVRKMGTGRITAISVGMTATALRFGKNASQSMMGLQMACAYLGSTFSPPLIGLLTEKISITIYPVFQLVFTGVMILLVEYCNRGSHLRRRTVNE